MMTATVSNGLWDYPSDSGRREIYEPLATEIREQQIRKGVNEQP